MKNRSLYFLSLFSLLWFSGHVSGDGDSKSLTVSVPSSPDIIRVRILQTRAPIRLGSEGTFRFGSRKDSVGYTSPSSLRVRASGGSIHFGRRKLRSPVAAVPISADDPLSINGKKYRGTLLFHLVGNGRIEVIEYLTMSEYLYGVLPKEISYAWPLEALKAQAVVSRSYALATKASRGRERFDVSATVLDQVYGGFSSEHPESNQAVRETEGHVIIDPAGNPIRAFFHAACGGGTELPERVWRADPVQDVYDAISDSNYCVEYPRYQWELTLSYSTLRDRLRRAGLRLKSVKDVSVLTRSPSGRAQTLIVHTSKGEIHVAGNRFRLALGPETLRSTYITDIRPGKKSVTFVGRGWGHGVGLCQWGMRGRALAGQTYMEILQAYYPKAKFKRQ
jgi:stage II sporulation protein D